MSEGRLDIKSMTGAQVWETIWADVDDLAQKHLNYQESLDYEKTLPRYADTYSCGWHAASFAYRHALINAIGSYEPRFQSEADRFFHLVSEEYGIYPNRGQDGWWVNLNDFWSLGCDLEEIPPEEEERVYEITRLWGWRGLMYWVHKRRDGELPITHYNKNLRGILIKLGESGLLDEFFSEKEGT